MKVLVTGAFGWTAKSIIETLYENGYKIVAFDISEDIPEYLHDITKDIYIGDVSSYHDVKMAIKGCEYVVHLAVATGEDDYDTPNIPFDVNVKGTYNIFNLSREYGVKRVILMSEAPVHIKLKERNFNALYSWKSSKDNDHLYDLTKRLQETIAKDFSETFNMDVIVLRPGHIVDGIEGVDPMGRKLEDLDYCLGGWICRYDLAQGVLRGLELKASGYNSFHIIGSWQSRKHYDISRTEEELGLRFESTFRGY